MPKKILLPPKFLGLSGTVGSGKDTVAAWLNQHYGYYHISTGDMVREVAKSRYNSDDWPLVQRTANELRSERGGGVLVELAVEHYKPQETNYPRGVVITGIRSIGEVKSLHGLGGWLLFIDAPTELRHQRVLKRERGDKGYFETREATENTSKDMKDETVQNLEAVEAMSDATIINNHSLAQFLEDVRQILDLKKLKA